MFRRLLFAVGVLTSIVAATPSLNACGDKFLLIGRALKYRQTYASAHPASILAYTQSPRVADLVGKQGLGALLKLVGHHVRVVDSPALLEQALKAEHFDVVIVAADAATELRIRAGGAQVVPVLFGANQADARANEQKFGCVLKMPSQGADVLAVVDRAVKLKQGRSVTH
jgi:hypothetical protein